MRDCSRFVRWTGGSRGQSMVPWQKHQKSQVDPDLLWRTLAPIPCLGEQQPQQHADSRDRRVAAMAGSKEQKASVSPARLWDPRASAELHFGQPPPLSLRCSTRLPVGAAKGGSQLRSHGGVAVHRPAPVGISRQGGLGHLVDLGRIRPRIDGKDSRQIKAARLLPRAPEPAGSTSSSAGEGMLCG